jgi:hypothetical protein
MMRSPEVIVRPWRVARQSLDGLSEADVREAFERLDPLWDELFPAEQARIVQLLVERVDISTEGADKVPFTKVNYGMAQLSPSTFIQELGAAAPAPVAGNV